MSRILIADDHPFLRAGVEALLEDAGHQIVASVGDGAAALAAIDAENPDVAIIDVRMPEPGGVQLLKILRQRGDRRAVIVLTAEVDDDDLVELVQAGANAILFKHCAEDRLVDAVSAVHDGKILLDPSVLDRAMKAALRPRQESPLEKLSRRERDIAAKAMLGMRNRQIAEALDMTEGTVKAYLHNIYAKLNIGNRAGLVALLAASADTRHASA